MKTRSARWRRIVMPLIVLSVIAVIAVIWSGSGQPVIGSGSTLAQPLIEQSAVAYRNQRSADNPGAPGRTGNDWVVDGSGIDYEPVGSLGGILRLADPEVDFAISDYPVSRQTLDELKVAQFPVAVGAVAVVHNLDLPAGQVLRLDAATLASIYQRRITTWNDPAIVALNPGVTLPSTAINAVHRSDGSGSTFGLTRYLSSGSAEWASGPGAGSQITWPDGTSAAERSGGLVQAVQGTPGSLGYVEPGQARRAGLRIAELKNTAGAYAGPTTAAMEAAIATVDFSGKDDYVDLQPTSASEGAYPITVPIYALLKRESRFRADTQRTLKFLQFLVDDYDVSAQDLGYLPLPAEGASLVKAYWARTFNFVA